MKNFGLVCFLVFGASTLSLAQDNARWGSACGLTDTKDDSWKEVESIDLNRARFQEISRLKTLVKQQLIIAAKDAAKNSSDRVEIRNTTDAVEYLRRVEGPVVVTYKVRGNRFTEVLGFPGDNPVGVIFKDGTTQIVAFNSDDDIICRR